ncbi:hypothetical protein PFISCL1PPCAC_27152, partial [Pristionchus fissidentatus]
NWDEYKDKVIHPPSDSQEEDGDEESQYYVHSFSDAKFRGAQLMFRTVWWPSFVSVDFLKTKMTEKHRKLMKKRLGKKFTKRFVAWNGQNGFRRCHQSLIRYRPAGVSKKERRERKQPHIRIRIKIAEPPTVAVESSELLLNERVDVDEIDKPSDSSINDRHMENSDENPDEVTSRFIPSDSSDLDLEHSDGNRQGELDGLEANSAAIDEQFADADEMGLGKAMEGATEADEAQDNTADVGQESSTHEFDPSKVKEEIEEEEDPFKEELISCFLREMSIPPVETAADGNLEDDSLEFDIDSLVSPLAD